MNSKSLILAVLLTASSGILAAAELVQNGKAKASIILDVNASKAAQMGALELQWHVEKMTGAKLPIVTSLPATGTKIFIGESAYVRKAGFTNDKFKNQEYLIRVKDNEVILTGRDLMDHRKVDYKNFNTFPYIYSENGSLYATYDFLEKLGFHWYMPSELGITYTKKKDLRIGDLQIRRVPTLRSRMYGNIYFPADLIGDTMQNTNNKSLSKHESDLYGLRMRFGGKNQRVNHSFGSWKNRFKNRKDFFAKGYDTPTQLCYTNPDVIRQTVQDARDYFDGKKTWSQLIGWGGNIQSDIYPVVPLDNRSWCQCANCQKMLLKKATRINKHPWKFDNRASDYIFNIANEVAKEIRKTHPGKYIGVLAYGGNFFPPEKIKLEPNVMINLCVVNTSPDVEMFAEWKKRYPKNIMGIYVYYCLPSLEARQYQTRLFPGFTGTHTEKFFRACRKGNVQQIFWEAPILYYSFNSAALELVEGHILWQLAWNENQSGKKLFDDLFVNFFGPAAVPMKKFYLNIDEGYNNPKYYPNPPIKLNEEISWGKICTPERLKYLENCMKEAKSLAKASPFKERVELFDKAILQYIQKGRKAYLKTAERRSGTMQQVEIPKIKVKVPGNAESADWNSVAPLILRGGLKGEPLKKAVELKVLHDGKWFYVRMQEKCDTSKLVTDRVIWHNDSCELYFGKQRGEPFYHMIFDSKGNSEWLAHMDAQINNMVMPTAKVKVVKQAKQWTGYVAIPLDDIVPNGIKPGEMLYFNMIRSAKAKVSACWIPTFSGFNTPSRFGELYLEKDEDSK